MQSQLSSSQQAEGANLFLEVESSLIEVNFAPESPEKSATKPVCFATHFRGYMGMYGDPQTVAEYLNDHEGWFRRCAQPMQAEPLGDNGYALSVGRFGSHGYELEPKLGVVLLPPEQGIYKMHSIPIPDYTPTGYAIDYDASLQLVEVPESEVKWNVGRDRRKHKMLELTPAVTQVEWQLQMKVEIEFPKFVQKLPQSLVKTTGDRLLTQIIRQISPRLTYKVQQDFHQRLGLPVPPKSSRQVSTANSNQ